MNILLFGSVFRVNGFKNYFAIVYPSYMSRIYFVFESFKKWIYFEGLDIYRETNTEIRLKRPKNMQQIQKLFQYKQHIPRTALLVDLGLFLSTCRQ